MAPDQKKKVVTTLITAGIFILIFAQTHSGFMAVFFVLPLLIWTSICVFLAYRTPELARMQFTRIAIWVTALTLVGMIHYARHVMVRQEADQIVAQVKAYRAKNGHCPETLDAIGISRDELTKRVGYSFYRAEPCYLTYAATFIIYDRYYFDFQADRWKYHAD